MAGAGGTATELFEDRALELPPLSQGLARRMLESLRTWRLLSGFRGRPPCDMDRLVDVLVRFSYLVAEHPEIDEFDINPLLAAPDQIIVLDARATIDRGRIAADGRPYDHLAIRPYPVEYVRCEELKDGTPVTLRPIRADDEPMWRQLLNGEVAEISPQLVQVLRLTTHAASARHCFVDYEQELTIVAEQPSDGKDHMVAIGRLAARPGDRVGDCALLVADRWQEMGLGAKLTAFLLEVAARWGLQQSPPSTAGRRRCRSVSPAATSPASGAGTGDAPSSMHFGAFTPAARVGSGRRIAAGSLSRPPIGR